MDSRQHERARRRFSVDEKVVIIAEYEQALVSEHGAATLVLRRHGISREAMSNWRKDNDLGLLVPGRKAGRAAMDRKERAEYLRLKKENEALRARLARSESAVEILGKASALLESLSKSAQMDHVQDSAMQEENPEATPPPGQGPQSSAPAP
jgi:transposase